MITNTQVLLDVLSPFQPALFGKPGTIHYSSVGNNTSFLEPGRMYIIPCDQFLTFPEKSRAAAFICYGDSSVFRPELAPKTIPVILLQQPAQFLTIWETIQTVLFRPYEYLDFQNKMYSIALSSKDLTAMLQAATQFINMPFSVYDRTARLLAYSYNQTMTDDNMLLAELSSSFATTEHLDSSHQLGVYGLMREKDGIVQYTLPSGIRKIAASIYIDDTYFGMLCAYDFLRPFIASDLDMVRNLRDIISLFLRSKYEDYNYLDSDESALIHTLLCQPLAQDELDNQLTRLGVALPEEMQLLVITEPLLERQSKNVACGLIRRYLTPLFPSQLSMIHELNVVFLLDAQQFPLERSSAMEKLTGVLERNNLYAAVSNVFTDLSDLKLHYDLTKQTLEIGEREQTGNHLFPFTDHMIDHLVNLAHQVVSMKAFQHPIFRTLRKYDGTYNTEYFPTLLHYLKSGGNMSICAKELDIHYNTMKYRLKNIKQITHSDVSAPNVFSALYLSMHAMGYHTNHIIEG